MFEVEFKGIGCNQFDIFVVRRPDIPAPEENIEEIEVPGRDGILTRKNGTYKKIIIEIPFNFMVRPEKWGEAFRRAKQWLTGSGELMFSDDPAWFYKVCFCRITSSERTSKRIGTFTAEFTCDPYVYSKDGASEKEVEEVECNPYYICHPVYIVTGEGICTLTVNKKTFQVNVGQEVIIDSDLMMTYRNGEDMNTISKGDYEDLYLQPGNNVIEHTGGFKVKIIPNWRSL